MLYSAPKDQVIQDLTFKLTCSACPEQYDVFDKDNEQVAYVRLRHGSLSLSNADISEDWWETDTNDTNFPKDKRLRGDAMFDDDDERTFFLNFIAKIIHRKLQNPSWEVWQENGLYQENPPTENEFAQSIVLDYPSKFIGILQEAVRSRMAQMQALLDDDTTPDEKLAEIDYGNDKWILEMIHNDLADKSKCIKGSFYQLTQSFDEAETMLQPFGKPIMENQRLRLVFSAESWEEAMTIKHKILGFEPYKPLI